ncbi:MAG TPA: hypothetical protein VGI24_04790 [Solirubrobacteraceae bacterium]|jgi:hypothetical protein
MRAPRNIAGRSLAGLSALALVLGLCSVAAAPARADFGAIELQSVGPLDQFESASAPAISADGSYLAMQGTLDGVEGIFRKDLQTGQLQLVAGGSTYVKTPTAPRDASAPSISADGRYVSFTSAVALVAAAKPGGNVYVRDMDVASDGAACTPEAETTGRCAFELASALNTPGASTEGLTYSGQGASAAGRVALSADGREVAFTIGSSSNLTSEPGGSTPGTPTPGGQVAVRYLDRHETILVSAERNASNGQMTERPVAGGAVASGAALSGDGSTVAWLGLNIPAQVPLLSDERTQIERDDGPSSVDESYDEPLWRRIADGPLAPTRRIVGGGDPLAPGCPPGGTLATAACRGPFPELAFEKRGDLETHLGWVTINTYDATPQLSADGWKVALLGDPPFSTSNVFVADMQEGLSRSQTLHQLTREVPVPFKFNPGSNSVYTPTAGEIYEIGISPDGNHVAFTTQREQFPLAPPFFAETPLATLGLVELYEIDLDAEALVRVTHGPDGGPSLISGSGTVTADGAASPSYVQNGGTLAFADSASNLVSGDANEAEDVFTVESTQVPTSPGPVLIGPAPGSREPSRPQWRLSVVPVTHANGTVTLDVVIPGAGRVTATAAATVPVVLAVHSKRTDRRAPRRVVKASVRASGSRRVARSVLEHRTVAHAQMSGALPEMLELPLKVSSPYAGLLGTAAGIYASVRVTFAGAGGPPLEQTLAISLRRVNVRVTAKKRAKTKKSGRSTVRSSHGAKAR